MVGKTHINQKTITILSYYYYYYKIFLKTKYRFISIKLL